MPKKNDFSDKSIFLNKHSLDQIRGETLSLINFILRISITLKYVTTAHLSKLK